jgi:hypothetical protein
MHLSQFWFDLRLESQTPGKRRNGLVRALKGRDVDRIDVHLSESVSDHDGLRLPMFGKRRVALPVNKVKKHTFDKWG